MARKKKPPPRTSGAEVHLLYRLGFGGRDGEFSRCGMSLAQARDELRAFRKLQRGRGYAPVEVIDGFIYPAADCVMVRNGLVGDYL